MMSTLSPAFLQDLVNSVGIPRTSGDAQNLSIPADLLCLLALSSKEMFNALCHHIRHSCHFETETPYPDMLIIRASSEKVSATIEFTEQFHVKALLKIAGENILNIRAPVPTGKWMEPFVEGLSNNKCLETIHESAGEHLFAAYARGNNTFPIIEAPEFLNKPWSPSMRNLVHCRPIRQLSIDPTGSLHKSDLMKAIDNIDIKALHIAQTGFVVNQNIFNKYRPKMRALKQLHCYFEVYTNVIREIMIKYTGMDEVFFRHGIFRAARPNSSFKNTIITLLDAIVDLWNVISAYPGRNIAIWTKHLCVTKASFNDVRSICETYLKDFEIYNIGVSICCRYRKLVDKKILVVETEYLPECS